MSADSIDLLSANSVGLIIATELAPRASGQASVALAVALARAGALPVLPGTGGDRGKAAISRFGCGSCHTRGQTFTCR